MEEARESEEPVTEEETTDFGEIDEAEFVSPVVTMDTWVKPQPRVQAITMDFESGFVFVPPPPVTVKKAECSKSGGMGMEFERPVIVPPFFENKGTRARRRLQEANPLENESYQDFKQ